MIRSKHLRVGAAAGTVVISLVALAGCSGKTSVSGKVTFDGKSVDDRGVISFRPVGQGRSVAGEIKGGMYYLDVDKGLAAGTYKAAIRPEESNIGMSRCEGNHVLVRMHTHRWVLGIVGHIGEARTGIGRSVQDGAPAAPGIIIEPIWSPRIGANQRRLKLLD